MRDSEQVNPAANRSRYVLFLVAPHRESPHPATPGVRLLRRPPLPRAEPSWPPFGRAVPGIHERSDEVYGDGEDDGGVLLDGDLPHRLKQPELQRCRALQTVRRLPEAL